MTDGDESSAVLRRGLREALSNARVLADEIKGRVNGLLAENAELWFRVRELEAGVREHRKSVRSDLAERASLTVSDVALWALIPGEGEGGDDGEA